MLPLCFGVQGKEIQSSFSWLALKGSFLFCPNLENCELSEKGTPWFETTRNRNFKPLLFLGGEGTHDIKAHTCNIQPRFVVTSEPQALCFHSVMAICSCFQNNSEGGIAALFHPTARGVLWDNLLRLYNLSVPTRQH